MTTIETILSAFQDWVMNKKEIPPHLWMEGAMKLNVLLQNEYDKVSEIEQFLAIQEGELLAQQMTSARAKTEMKKLPEWLTLQKQKGKVKTVEEFVRLAKKHAQIISDQLRNNL